MFPPELQDAIAEIAAIAEACPEPFREACFSVLLTHYLGRHSLQDGVPVAPASSVNGHGESGKNAAVRANPPAAVVAPAVASPKNPRAPEPLKRALLATGLAALAFFLLEAAIFRSGWYFQFLEPISSAGVLESHLQWLNSTPPGQKPEAMVIGDSRIAEGFSPTWASEALANKIRFWNFGIGGSTPRVWYYALRDIDPNRNRFKALVFALPTYSDADSYGHSNDRLIDLNFVVGRLRLTDCLDFAISMGSAKSGGTALAGCLLKGLTLRSDIHAWLDNRQVRDEHVRYWRDYGLAAVNGYPGNPASLSRGCMYCFECYSTDCDESFRCRQPGLV